MKIKRVILFLLIVIVGAFTFTACDKAGNDGSRTEGPSGKVVQPISDGGTYEYE